MRRLLPVPAEPGPGFEAALLAALDGSGPALLPVPPDPAEARRVLAATRPEEPLEDDEVALVVPTSGSTGEPKGVLLTGACLAASAAATERRLGGTGSWLLALPVTHIAGIQVVQRALLAGAAPVVASAAPAAFVAGADELPPGRRFTSLVPTQLRRLLAAGPAALTALGSFDAVLLGGAAAPAGLLADARAAGVHLVTTYGMSETSGGCVYDGVPLDGVSIGLEDRITLTGDVVARGYRLRPDLTHEAFAATGATRTYRTNDAGTLDADGRLVVLGRIDEIITTGAEKVAPAAVEAALLEHPAVADVAVVGVPDPEWGQRVVAVVVLHGGTTLDLGAARDHVAARVSRVAAPRELRIVPALPMLASGKVDRQRLRLAG